MGLYQNNHVILARSENIAKQKYTTNTERIRKVCHRVLDFDKLENNESKRLRVQKKVTETRNTHFVENMLKEKTNGQLGKILAIWVG